MSFSTITQLRYGRLRSWACVLICLLWFGAAHAGSPLNGAWRNVLPGDTPQQVMQEYHAGLLKSFDPALLHPFPDGPQGSWVVIAPQPPWDNEARVLVISPPPMSKVTVFGPDGKQTLALDDFSASAHGHGRLGWQVPPSMAGSTPILLRFEPATTLSAPVSFELQSSSQYLTEDAQWLSMASACLAVMLAMALMALCFSVMLRDVTFAWYVGYILCFALIQAVQTGFVFHPLEWRWIAGQALAWANAAVALSVAFASLFMIRFCELPSYAPLARVPILALAVGMILVTLMHFSGVALLVAAARDLLNPLLILGAVLLLVAAIVAAARGSRHSWFFLAGWTPLLLLTALTSAQTSGALPDAGWLNDANLVGGAFEALVLSLGLADRALRLRQDHQVVQSLADHDALTNVLNRRSWSERARERLSSGPERPIAVLFLDLDHFKLLNDHLGHRAGDRALVEVSKVLEHELRPSDLFGRYGGEEFVVLLDGTHAEQAMYVAKRLCRRVHRLDIAVSTKEALLLSISIGVAMRQAGDDLETLVERADEAMYRAKLGGRNQACLYSAASPVPNVTNPPRLQAVERRPREG